MAAEAEPASTEFAMLTAEIVAAYVNKNALRPADLPTLISDVYSALTVLVSSPAEPEPAQLPAVSIRKSITADFIVCLEDGKRFKSLKRHLTQLGMTPGQYREKWKLPSDYPMTAPNYSAVRSGLAKANGLGRCLPALKRPVKTLFQLRPYREFWWLGPNRVSSGAAIPHFGSPMNPSRFFAGGIFCLRVASS